MGAVGSMLKPLLPFIDIFLIVVAGFCCFWMCKPHLKKAVESCCRGVHYLITTLCEVLGIEPPQFNRRPVLRLPHPGRTPSPWTFATEGQVPSAPFEEQTGDLTVQHVSPSHGQPTPPPPYHVAVPVRACNEQEQYQPRSPVSFTSQRTEDPPPSYEEATRHTNLA